MPRGGKREGAGRKKVDRSTTQSVAVNVLRKQKAEVLWNEMVETNVTLMRATGKTGPLRDTLRYLEDRAYGRPVQQIRVGNPDSDKFQVRVDVTSARDKLMAALLGPDQDDTPA